MAACQSESNTFVVNNYFLPPDVFVKMIEEMRDVTILYAEDETISPMDDAVLEQITRKKYVVGKHISFVDPKFSKGFFEEFERLL